MLLGILICYVLINLIMEVVIIGYKIFIGWDNDFTMKSPSAVYHFSGTNSRQETIDFNLIIGVCVYTHSACV